MRRDVILDFGCWAKEERDAFCQKAKELGVDFKLHYMGVSTDELFDRMEKRNKIQSDQTFVIPKEDMKNIPSTFGLGIKRGSHSPEVLQKIFLKIIAS